MRGEGAEVIGNGLLIADVGEDLVKDGKRGLVGRDRNTGLSHEREQAHGLQHNSLASGVRPADDENTARGVKIQRDRSDPASLAAKVVFEQRMPGLDEAE